MNATRTFGCGPALARRQERSGGAFAKSPWGPQSGCPASANEQKGMRLTAWLLCAGLSMATIQAATASAQTGPITVQGSEDPLLRLDHTGQTGNPALWFQQDGVDKAFLWWNQINSSLNLGTPSANPLLILRDNGNVGIGTNNPRSRLEIAGQDGLAISGFQPFLTLRDTNASGARSIIAAGNGDFGFYPNSFLGGYPAVVLKNQSGNMGIGVPSPTRKLEVAGVVRSTGGFMFPDGSVQTTATERGPAGPRGPEGPPGPPGPPAHTSAVCVDATTSESGYGSCPGRTVSSVRGNCSVTSDTGVCSAFNAQGPVQTHTGACCVCAP
jgi:hypothetical protein